MHKVLSPNISWLIAFFLLFSAKSFALTLDELQDQLSQSTLVRGEFSQVRTMTMFNQPLTTSGTFLLEHQQGLLWQQSTPFPISLTLTQNKLRQSINGDSQIMNDKENPMAFYFTRLFLSLFKGDTKAIKENFTMELKGSHASWTLLLTPIASPIDRVFSSITIEGSTYVNRVVLNEVRGDTTEMQFSQQSSTPETLTTEELRAFTF